MHNWAILLSRILCSELNIFSKTALSPQDHWSIPQLNMVPYWHWQLASLHSGLSICLINSIYFKHTVIDQYESGLKWLWNSEKRILLSVMIKEGYSSHNGICIESLYLQGAVYSSCQQAPSSTCREVLHSIPQWDQMDNSWTRKLIIFQVDSVAVCADAGTSYMSDCMELCWSGAKNVDNTNSCSSGMVTKMEICLHIHRVHSESNISEENWAWIIYIQRCMLLYNE